MILDTPIKKQSLQKMAYQSLRQAILEREIEPGAVIKISKLAEKLNVSTMPVREALRQLEVESMVSFNSNKSIVASRLSRAELHDIYDLRIPLEVMALLKCFDRCDKQALKHLGELNRKMSKKSINGSKWFNLNRVFHLSLFEMSGSPRLCKILQGLWNSTGPYLRIFSESEKAVTRANREHTLILDAFRNGDRAKAKKVLRKHLRNGLWVIESHLETAV
jgi:DNA-binding GntR family transcriptional regulator